jgi:hypothetical protein
VQGAVHIAYKRGRELCWRHTVVGLQYECQRMPSPDSYMMVFCKPLLQTSAAVLDVQAVSNDSCGIEQLY